MTELLLFSVPLIKFQAVKTAINATKARMAKETHRMLTLNKIFKLID